MLSLGKKVTPFHIKFVFLFLTVVFNSWCATALVTNDWILISSFDQIPSKNVYSVLCDRNGLLWFTSDRGIFTYDGQRFKTINSDQGLSGNEIFSLYETSDGDLWPVSLDGKISTIKHDRIFNWSTNNYLKKFDAFDGQTQGIVEIAPHVLVIVNSANIVIHNTATRQTQLIPQKGGTLIRQVLSTEQKFVILASTQIKIIDRTSQLVKTIHPKLLQSFSASTKSHVLKNELYTSVQGDLVHLNLGSDLSELRHKKYDFGIQKIVSLHDSVYLCTTTGIYQLDQNLNLTDTLLYQRSITDFCEDRYGNLWASSNGDGIYMMLKPTSIEQIKPADSLFQPNKLVISSGEKALYVGSQFGKVDELIHRKIIAVSPSKSVKSSSSDLKNVYTDESQTLIALGSELLILREKKESKNISAKSVLKIGKKYLIGVHTGVFSMENIQELPFQTSANYFQYNSRNTALVQLDPDEVAVGSVTGISSFRLTEDTALCTYYYPTRTVTDVIAIGDTLIFSTSGQGIGIKLPNNPPAFIDKSHGLESNIVDEIDVFNKTIFYLSGNQVGTVDLHRSNNSNTNIKIGRFGSLIPDPVLSMAIFNDTLYFVSENGLKCAPASAFKNYAAQPTLRISSVYYKTKDITDFQNPELDLNQGNLQFNIEIITPYKTFAELEYKLPELHEDWITTNDRHLMFSELPSGQHQIYFRLANSYEADIISYTFTVSPEFYESIWFYVLLGGIFIISIFITIKRVNISSDKKNKKIQDQLRKEKELAEISQRLVELEMLSLRQQINPHFIFNTLNSIQGFYSTGNTDQAEKQISMFSSLVRKILSTNAQNLITIKDELLICKLYLDLMQMRFENKFSYEIVGAESLTGSYGIIPLVLQPFVENCIVHGFSEMTSNGLIKIDIREKNETLVCTILDNGVPFELISTSANEKRQYKSMGIRVTFDRIKLWCNTKGLEPTCYAGKKRNGEQGYEIEFEFPKIKLYD